MVRIGWDEKEQKALLGDPLLSKEGGEMKATVAYNKGKRWSDSNSIFHAVVCARVQGELSFGVGQCMYVVVYSCRGKPTLRPRPRERSVRGARRGGRRGDKERKEKRRDMTYVRSCSC